MAHRIERVNSLIRQELSDMLQRQVKDPRLGNFITVNAVSTSADLKYARIFVSSISDEVKKTDILEGLISAAGYFRREMARTLKLRTTPELRFQWDDSIERADHLSKLIDEIAGPTQESV